MLLRPQSDLALSVYRSRVKPAQFQLLSPQDTPTTARLDAGAAHSPPRQSQPCTLHPNLYRNHPPTCQHSAAPPADPPPSRPPPPAVFSLPQELWPVLPPGAMYCLEPGSDTRASYGFLAHADFPDIKVPLPTALALRRMPSPPPSAQHHSTTWRPHAHPHSTHQP
jgi:hypothetical protein